MDILYLDNNATTRPDEAVIAAVTHAMSAGYANPSSLHRPGQDARKAVDDARSAVAGLIGCSPAELLFTSGGTESINTAIRGLFRLRKPRRRVLISSVEHSATQGACNQIEADGAEIVQIPVDAQGLLDLEELQHQLTEEVALVSLMWANNETGVLFDIPAAAALCRKAKVPLHCDGTQAVGKIAVDVRAAGVDMMSFAAHKFHGPKGAGGLYVRRGQRMSTLIAGGPQELGRRGGTENVPGVVGMGAAARLAKEHQGEMTRVAALRDRLEAGILAAVPETFVNGSREYRLPNTTNIGFARLESEAILMLLSERGLCASAGAACSSGSLEASHVLKAMHIDPKVAHGAIRLSLSRYTTEAEIERALQIIPEVIVRLRKVLPVG